MSHSSQRFRLDLQRPIHRRAVRTAIAIMLSLVVVHSLKLPHGDWVVISAFIVSRDTIGNTLWKAKGRFLGTVSGAVAALLFYALIRQYHSLIFITAFLTVFPYLYLRPSLGNYGYAKFFQQFAFICFLGAISQQPSVELMEWRAIDIAIGCILGIAVAIFVLPNWSQFGWRQSQLAAWNDLHLWFKAILVAYQSPPGDRQHLEQLNRKAQSSVFQLDEYLASRQQELMIKPKEGYHWVALMQSHAEIIRAYRHIYASLLYFSTMIDYSNSDCSNTAGFISMEYEGAGGTDPARQSVSPTHPALHPSGNSYIDYSNSVNPSTDLSTKTREVIQQLTGLFEQIGATIGTRSPLQIPQIPLINSPDGSPVNRAENPNELNISLQLNQIWEALAHYIEARNQFLSLLANKP